MADEFYIDHTCQNGTSYIEEFAAGWGAGNPSVSLRCKWSGFSMSLRVGVMGRTSIPTSILRPQHDDTSFLPWINLKTR